MEKLKFYTKIGQKFYTKDLYQYVNYAAATTLLLLNAELTVTHAEKKPLEVYKGRPKTDCSQSMAEAFPTSLKKEGNDIRKRLRTKKTKWEVAIKVENKTIQLGTFESQEEATHLYDRSAFMYGQVPNFEFPEEEEEKEELKHLNWEQFLEITRHGIANKIKPSFLDSLFCPLHIIKHPRTEMTKWEVAIKVENKTDHLGTFESREEAMYLCTRAAFMHGQKPKFELPEEKQELKHLNWEQFLEITRRGIANKRL